MLSFKMSKQGNLSPNIFVEPNTVELVAANRLINNQLGLPYGQNGAAGGPSAPTTVNGHWAFFDPGQTSNYQALQTGQLVQYGEQVVGLFWNQIYILSLSQPKPVNMRTCPTCASVSIVDRMPQAFGIVIPRAPSFAVRVMPASEMCLIHRLSLRPAVVPAAAATATATQEVVVAAVAIIAHRWQPSEPTRRR